MLVKKLKKYYIIYNMIKIVFTGGGTGGHIFPIIAIARELKKRTLDLNLRYIGPKDFISDTFLPKEGIILDYVSSGKVRRYFSFEAFFSNLIDVLFKIPFGTIQAFCMMFVTAPDVIISKGGFGSIPAVIAGWILRIPIFMHESDSIPGMANRLLSKFSERIFVSFPIKETEYFPNWKMIEAGNPIRTDLIEGNEDYASKIFLLTSEKPVILILGGSQGSERINDLVAQVLPDILKEFEIIHQTGKAGYLKAKNEAVAVIAPTLLKYYHPYFFLNDNELKSAYAACDCIIARAGAGTIFEIAAVRKPSILIPLTEAAQNHQVKNAYSYANAGAAIVLEEGNLTPNFFLQEIREILSPENTIKMKRAAAEFSKPDAAGVIARFILDYLS